VLDGSGKEVSREVIAAAEFAPEPLAGGRVKVAPLARIFRNEVFGYTVITVKHPLRDENGKPVMNLKGKLKGQPPPDSALRDTENVPLDEDIKAYFQCEVLPHAPDAWIDEIRDGQVVWLELKLMATRLATKSMGLCSIKRFRHGCASDASRRTAMQAADNDSSDGGYFVASGCATTAF
jgi:hypothetical protein